MTQSDLHMGGSQYGPKAGVSWETEADTVEMISGGQAGIYQKRSSQWALAIN
jgi:hypothetical protein